MIPVITTPLDQTDPFGINLNYDPDFETLRNEIGKSGKIDFNLIESLSVKIISEKSKDIRVLSFLSLAYLWKENWECFADVFDGFAVLAQQNYNALKPDRDRAKRLALEWLSGERYTGLLADKNPGEVDYIQVIRLKDALVKIKSILEDVFAHVSPFPSKLLDRVHQWEISCKPLVSVQKTLGNIAQEDSVRHSIEKGTNKTPGQIQSGIREAVSQLIQKEPLRPMGYRLMRSLRWDILDKAPPSENGKTQLSGPQPQQRTLFDNLIAHKEWKDVLQKAEAVFSCGSNHLWLDLQRMVFVACRECGIEYASVGDAVFQETEYLLRRIPDLINLCFSDSTPFCDEITRKWIGIKLKTASVMDNVTGIPLSVSNDGIGQQNKRVDEMVLAGQINEALEFLQNSIRASADERENFHRSIKVGEVLLGAAQAELAVAVLEYLDQKISFYNLDKWEPDLTVEAWVVLLRAYRAIKVKQQNLQVILAEKQSRILGKITQINPKRGFMMNK